MSILVYQTANFPKKKRREEEGRSELCNRVVESLICRTPFGIVVHRVHPAIFIPVDQCWTSAHLYRHNRNILCLRPGIIDCPSVSLTASARDCEQSILTLNNFSSRSAFNPCSLHPGTFCCCPIVFNRWGLRTWLRRRSWLLPLQKNTTGPRTTTLDRCPTGLLAA